MQVVPYLFFNGNCAEAFKFYEQCFGGKIEALLTHSGTPAAEHVPAEWQEKILHARMSLGDQVLMASDAPPGRYSRPQGFSVSISVSEVSRAERIFNALSAGGEVTMPFEKTFWAERFGMCTDRFGIPWMINAEAAQQAG